MEELDLNFMQQCINLSRKAVEKGDAPFGSLVAKADQLIAVGVNDKNKKVSDHAEILALHHAHLELGTSDLRGCTLYTSCEPCPMCSFMIREYKISRVVFGIKSPHMGGSSKWPILKDEGLTRLGMIFSQAPEVIGGVMEKEALEVMRNTPLHQYFK
ncbi:nucleoside deaminase [bacterium]|nr:nucleoside deaminase [bacterium]